MTDKVGPEKVDALRAHGAEVVVCPVAVAPEDPASYYSTAERLVNEIPGSYRPNQYHNQTNPQAHYATTGPEIWRQTDGTVTHFVAGAGTGGWQPPCPSCSPPTSHPLCRRCRNGRHSQRRRPPPQGTEPCGAGDRGRPRGVGLLRRLGRPYLVEGVGEDFFPDRYDAALVDRTIAVSDRDSFLTARRVSQEEGLLIGGWEAPRSTLR